MCWLSSSFESLLLHQSTDQGAIVKKRSSRSFERLSAVTHQCCCTLTAHAASQNRQRSSTSALEPHDDGLRHNTALQVSTACSSSSAAAEHTACCTHLPPPHWQAASAVSPLDNASGPSHLPGVHVHMHARPIGGAAACCAGDLQLH